MRRALVGRRAPGVAATVLVVVLALLPLTGSAYYMDMVQLCAIYFVVVTGLNVVSGYAGQLSVGHGALFGMGAYTSAIVTTRYEQPFVVGFVCAVVLTLLLGLLLGAPSLRLQHLYFAMITLGFAIVFGQLLLNWRSLTGGYLGIIGVPQPALFGVTLSGHGLYYALLAFAVACGWGVARIVRGRRGLWWSAIREDEVLARSMGLSPPWSKLTAFGLSAVLAGAAGSVYASYIMVLQPDTFDHHLGLLLLAMMLVGGGGYRWCAAFGVPLVVLVENLAPSGTVNYLLGAMMIILTVFVPAGVAGVIARRVHALRLAETQGSSAKTGFVAPVDGDQPMLAPPDGGQAGGLVVTGVRKSYGKVQALDGVDLTVRPGTVHAVIGPNGCGKTTLLNVILGLTKQDAGTCALGDADLTGASAHRRSRAGIARTFQTPRLLDKLTVRDNLLAAAGAPGQAADTAADRVTAALRLAGVEHLADELAGAIPPGSQRFVEIARAMSRAPRVILMDEPAGGMTGEARDRLMDLVLKIRDLGCAVVLVEHNVPFVMRAADEITVIDRGVVVAHGEPEEVRTDAAVIEAYLGS